MNQRPPRPITADEIEAYQTDGIICLRDMFDAEWIAHLREQVEVGIANPGPLVKNVNAEGSTGYFFSDTFLAHQHPGFMDVVKTGPGAEIAARLMKSRRASLVFDQMLVKEPTTSTPTPWHHDATYWPVAGDQIATLWLALDDVTYATGAVEYVKGSHRWGQRFLAVSFDPAQIYTEDLPPVPDIDAERHVHDIVWYEMKAGDCTVHHGLTVHAAPGNSSTGQRRRAYVQRWAGEDVTYHPRPNLQRMLRDPGLATGDALDCELFPVIWQAEPVAARPA